jgi:hypothetical protein
MQINQYIESHNKQVEVISNLRAELLMHRHVVIQAASVLQHMKDRLLNHYDAHSPSPQDRAVLLDADLVLAEAYKLSQKEVQP